MIKNYKRLQLKERIEIEKLLSHNKSLSEIAIALNRNKSTIARELKRQFSKHYLALKAEVRYVGLQSDRRGRKNKIDTNPELKKYVLDKLQKRWSPQLISVCLRKEFKDNKAMQLSHETIYMYIYLHCKKGLREQLIAELRQKRKYRGNTRRGADKRTTIKDPIRIDERPAEVMGREIPGHWEGDLIIGKNRSSAIGTLVERTTRTIIMVPLKNKNAETVRTEFEKVFNRLPKIMKKSLTYDNGTEMAEHKLFTKNTKVQVYFTHPYSPWERPTNENSNGLIRDYFPAGTDFNTISDKRLKEVQDELNERPRKVLDYRTPIEVFNEFILQKMI